MNDMTRTGEIAPLEVILPSIESLMEPARQLAAGLDSIVIDCDEVYQAVAADVKEAKLRLKAIEEARMSHTRPVDTLKRRIMDFFKPAEDAYGKLITEAQPKMIAYVERKEAEAREAERRAQEAARAERERLEREANEARRAAEAEAAAAQRKADEEAAKARKAAQEEAERLAAAGRTKEAAATTARAETEATRTAEAGQRAAAEALARGDEECKAKLDTAFAISAAPVIATPKAAGTSIPKKWKARVTDKQALIAHIAAHPDLENLLEVNETALNQMAIALKSNFKLPGVETFEDRSVRSR